MIHVTCAKCGVRLRAKAELAGTVRKCPKCGAPLNIPAAPPAADSGPAEPGDAETSGGAVVAGVTAPTTIEDASSGPTDAATAEQDGLPKAELPTRLNRQHHYLICGPTKLVATWEDNGQGWQIATGHGLVPAARNAAQLPMQGDFRLVELVLERTEAGRRLRGLRCYQLAPRYALPALARGDHDIMSKLVGPVGLDAQRKNVVRQVLHDQFMPQFWHEAANVLEYLSNRDYHSPGTP